jgi:hypothetical protein
MGVFETNAGERYWVGRSFVTVVRVNSVSRGSEREKRGSNIRITSLTPTGRP